MKTTHSSLFLACALALSTAQAAPKTWSGADAGLWSLGTNWSGGLPVIGDDVTMGTLGAATASVTANFNVTLTGAGLNSLLINSTGITGTFTLSQTVASTMIAANETIGSTISGNTYTQSAGTNSVTSTLTLGLTTGAGIYNLSGTGALSAVNETVGNAGTGNFNQTGGTNTINGGTLLVGNSNTSLASTYSLGGGTLTLALGGNVVVGNTGRASFAHSSGTMNFTGVTPGNLTLAAGNATNNNTYTLSNTGQITNASTLNVGKSGTATFTQTGGTIALGNLAAAGNLVLGDLASGNGTYNLSATTGTGSISVDNVTVGNFGTGAFNQSGGTLTVSNTFNMASNPGSTSSYALTGGSLNASGTATATVGGLGTAVFTHSAGTANLGTLTLATSVSGFTASGTYNLSGTGILNSGGSTVGFNSGATGIFNQTGGTHTITGLLQLGVNAGSSATYNLSAGALSASNENIGVNNSGGNTAAFVQTGGSNTITGNGLLSLGVNAASTGSYSMDASAGASTLNTTILRVGDSGTGTFTQNAGTVTVGAVGTIGRISGSTGTYNLNSGILNAGVNPNAVNFFVGGSGTGTMNQTGGTFTLGGGSTASLSLGATGGTGTYNLSGGSITTQFLQPGNGGTGNFIQTGGTVNATQINISTVAGSSGSYSLSGAAGVTLAVANFESIGTSATGTFTQTGGTHTLNGDMQLGQNASGSGIYNLSGGNLNVAFNIGVGQAGIGFLNQTGGALAVTGGLYVGSGSGSNGNYQISAGTGSVGTLYLGYSGVGSLYQNGGTLTVGTLNGGTIFPNFASATGTHTQTGGTLTVNNSFNLGIGGAASTYALGGVGVLNLPNNPGASQQMFIGGNGTFTQGGGTVNGYVFNSGQFVFNGGTFNGTLENGANGTATFNSFVFFGSGLKNHGTLNIGAAGQVGTAAGQTFTNDGTVNLSSTGQIYSNGPVINNGLITGTGSIGGSSTFVNNLSITQGAGPLTFSFAPGTAVNNGTVALAAGRALNLFGGFTNAGTFALNGASVIQNGTLANAPGGTVRGPGAILATFTNSGVVTPGGGTLNIASAWTNSGIAQLGSISDSLTGGAITNAGTIQGFGNVGAAVNNTSGVIEAIGGSLALGGTLTNAAGGTLAAGLGNKIVVSAGLTANVGVITLTGGTFDNNNHALTNTGQISGFGVVRTGGAGLTNAGSITLTGGNTTVNGNVTNNAGQMVRISYNPATFTGNVINNGTFKTTSTTSTFAGTFTNNGIFTSDPATQNFGTLVIGTSGALQGGLGDVFNISGDLVNNSHVPTLWDTTAAKIAFTGSTAHTLTWAATDKGATPIGFMDNFAVGDLAVAIGASLTLVDGGAPGGALYVGALDLPGGVSQLASITSTEVNIYYDATNSANGYLGNQTYALNGGAVLAPAIAGVPEPGSALLLALGLGVFAARRRRDAAR